MENHASKRLTGKGNYLYNFVRESFSDSSIVTQQYSFCIILPLEFGPYESPITEQDEFVPPPETLDVYLKKDPSGIQGHHNSCYLDATLFAAFAFSSVIDSILLRPKNDDDIEEYENVQTVLRDNIIYPLRS
jgi:AAA+ superfamily predicted ATPase